MMILRKKNIWLSFLKNTFVLTQELLFGTMWPSSDPVAQLVEQLPFKPWVVGSSPTRITNLISYLIFTPFIRYTRFVIRSI